MKKIFVFLTFCLCALALVAYYSFKLSNKYDGFQLSKSKGTVIKALPDVSFFSLDNQKEYNPVGNESKTKYTFIHFWATWCAPCEVEFPKLLKMMNGLDHSKISFLFVAVNDDLKKVRKFLDQFNGEIGVQLYDSEQVHQEYYGTHRLPESFLFAPGGQIIKKFTGAKDWSSEMLIKYIR